LHFLDKAIKKVYAADVRPEPLKADVHSLPLMDDLFNVGSSSDNFQPKMLKEA
jgi:hypothetical protein